MSKRTNHFNQGAFTLIELMISLTIGLFLIAGVGMYLLSNTTSYVMTTNITQLQESGRAAIKLISDSYRNAGYMGYRINPTINQVKNATSSSDTCELGNTNWLKMMNQPLFAVDNESGTYSNCIGSKHINESDVLVIRHASVEPVVSQIPTRLYIGTSIDEAEIFVAGGTSWAPLSQPSSVHQPVASAYFIGTSGRQCSGEDIPSLYRLGTNNSGEPILEELVPGIERLDARFLLSDGRFTPVGQISDWSEVTAVKIWLLARSPCPDRTKAINPDDEKERFWMPNGGKYPKEDDDFQYYRQGFTATVNIRNNML